MVGGVDRVALIVGLNEVDILFDAAGADVRMVRRLSAAEPGRAAAVDRADGEVVAVADDPVGFRNSVSICVLEWARNSRIRFAWRIQEIGRKA